MKLMLGRLSADWSSAWGHAVALAESFVDPALYRGTAYQASVDRAAFFPLSPPRALMF
jgi:hypothetical protein